MSPVSPTNWNGVLAVLGIITLGLTSGAILVQVGKVLGKQDEMGTKLDGHVEKVEHLDRRMYRVERHLNIGDDVVVQIHPQKRRSHDA